MLASSYYYFWEDWELYHKVTFDGLNRLIIINPDEPIISVRRDIYSAWKRWTQVRDHGKWLPAIRTTGGDPIGIGEFSGDLYFLINGWRVQIGQSAVVDGVIYSDNFPSPFVQVAGTQIVTNRVSALVQTIAPVIEGDIVVDGDSIAIPTVQEIRIEMDTNSVKLTDILGGINTANAGITGISGAQSTPEQVAQAVRTELSAELAHILTIESTGLTPTQATMLLEMYELLGLDPTKPLVVTKTARTAGTISQTIVAGTEQTTVSRD